MRQIISILDQGRGIVFIREVPKKLAKLEPEEILEAFCVLLSCHASDCSYMISDTLPIMDIKI